MKSGASYVADSMVWRNTTYSKAQDGEQNQRIGDVGVIYVLTITEERMVFTMAIPN